MNIIYSKASRELDPFYGKFEHTIRMCLEAEAKQVEAKENVLKALFNIEKSNNYGETMIGESEFGMFSPKKEGRGGANDTIEKTFDKHIEHISFSKNFYVTREMMDDAKVGISSDIKRVARGFMTGYQNTRVYLGVQALINGHNAAFHYEGEKIDLTAPDKKPLFHRAHTFATSKMRGKTQANYFWGNGITASQQTFEEVLGVAANRLRNFKTEGGESTNYTADVLIIPANRPHLERMAKKAIGSERTSGSDFNDINTQYGNWTLVVLPWWETEDDRFMIMSREANRNLFGNMFFNRVPLSMMNSIDQDTRNFSWNGYCRFGLGFYAWKHMALLVNSADAVADAELLDAEFAAAT